MYSFNRCVLIPIFSLACLSLTACPFPPRIYKMDLRQGNYITPEMTANLKVGLTKEQVLNLMGSPMSSHFFEPGRWDYYYYFKPGNGDPIAEKRISLFFKDGRVSCIDKSF
jgi:outer membrane protein assembly factor BamE